MLTISMKIYAISLQKDSYFIYLLHLHLTVTFKHFDNECYCDRQMNRQNYDMYTVPATNVLHVKYKSY